MEEVTEFLEAIAVILLFCTAVGLCIVGFNALERVEGIKAAQPVFKIIMTSAG